MKSNCKRYAQAITNSVIGEKVDVSAKGAALSGEPRFRRGSASGMTEEELAQHLKECPKCQKEYSNWQDVCDFIRVKEYHARPEVKAKWDNFLKELTTGKLTSKPAPAEAGSGVEKVSGTTCQNHTRLGGINPPQPPSPLESPLNKGGRGDRGERKGGLSPKGVQLRSPLSSSALNSLPKSLPKGKIVSVEELFSGHTGTVRKTIGKHGIVNFDELPAKSNLPPGIAYGAMVLLAQKKELCFVEHKDHVDLFVPR